MEPMSEPARAKFQAALDMIIFSGPDSNNHEYIPKNVSVVQIPVANVERAKRKLHGKIGAQIIAEGKAIHAMQLEELERKAAENPDNDDFAKWVEELKSSPLASP